ncbi:MAG: FmdB family zinc ribbon protein [Gemmatimonadales bacterium]
MPTYEYRCPRCGTEFEAFQKITSKPVAKCPKCGAKAERLMSAGAGLVFKGSGFYLTDYGRSGQKAKEAKAETEHKASSGEKTGGEKSGGDKPAGGLSPSLPSAPKSKPRKKDG